MLAIIYQMCCNALEVNPRENSVVVPNNTTIISMCPVLSWTPSRGQQLLITELWSICLKLRHKTLESHLWVTHRIAGLEGTMWFHLHSWNKALNG